MNLLCPNCQKMLTVPEQYAGQLMKCPLCAGTFTVPTLPAAPPAAPPPEVFSFKENAPATPPSSTPPSSTGTTTEPSAPPPPPPLPPGEYTRASSIWFSAKVIQVIPAVAMVLLFFLQLGPWVEVNYGSYTVAWQNAWGAAFSSKPTEENDLKGLFHWTTEKEVSDKEPKNWPTMSLLTLFYLFLFFFPTAPLTLACVALPFLPIKLPPTVQPFLKWKWALALLFNLLLFFVLFLQLIVGFGMESGIKDAETARQNTNAKRLEEVKANPMPKMQIEAEISQATSRVQISTFLEIAVLLHLLAIVSALLMFWLNQREVFNKPLPELTLRW